MTPDKRNLQKLYVASILGGFAFFYNAVETLYYRHFNLSFEQIGFLISLSLIVTLILEIPTGSFADIYGKKKSLLAGSLTMLAGLGFLAFSSSVIGFAIGFVLLGTGKAFNSGAGSALLFDTLSSMDQQHEYIKHQSRMQSSFVAIDIISGSLGFALFGLNVRLPFIISFVAMILVILVQLSIQENVIKKAYEQSLVFTHIQQIREGIAITLKSKIILWFIFFTLIYFVAGRAFSQILDLPFLTESKGFSTGELAIMGLIWNSIQTLIILVINKTEKRLGQNFSLLTIVTLTPALLFGLLLSSNYLVSAIIMGLFWGTSSFMEIIVESYMNQQLNSSHRATVLSINAMIASGVAVIILPLLGAVVDKAGLGYGMLVLIVGTLMLGTAALIVKMRIQAPSKQV